MTRNWPDGLGKGGVGKLHGICKGNVKNMSSRKISRGLDGKIHRI